MDNGLILSLYDVPGDAQPTDSVHNEGGALILNAQLELLFWGAAWQTASPSTTDVASAVEGMLASPYLLGLAEYGFQNATVRGSTIIATPDPPQNYSFDDAGNLVWNLIDDGRFPDPDDDGGRILYMVFMPPGTNPPLIPGTTDTAVGAHSDPDDFDLPDDRDYAWVGWVSNGPLEQITQVFSHELVEAITDPEPHDPAWQMNRAINDGKEIGDACNNTVDVVDGITVQAYWSERHKSCVIPKGLGPLPTLRSLEQGCRVQSGSAGSAYVSLDRTTPVDVTLALSSDDPDVLRVPATLVIPAGSMDGSVMLYAQPVVGAYQFVAIHAAFAGTTLTSQVEVTPRPSIITGVVRDTASRPVAQAHVSIDDGAGTALAVTTGSDGSYATGTLSPGTYTVGVSAYGFVPAEATVAVLEGVPATDTDFTLEARLPFTIAGTVTNSHGTPVVGAQVLLMQQNWDKRLDGVTDSTGGYTLSMDPMDYTGRYWLRVTAPGYAEGFLDLAIPNGASLREDFVLQELGVATGTVVVGGTSPTPVAGAEVKATISTDDPLTQPSVSVVSDSAGRYVLPLPPGSIAVTVRARGFETYVTTVAVGAGSTVERDFPLTAASASLSCTVSDVYSGVSINRAYVQAGGEFAGGIGNDDRYHVSNIPAGTQEVDIHADGCKPLKVSVDFTAGQTIATDFYLDPLVIPPHPPGPPHMQKE